ncbi:MAG: cytochrome C554, partial [bacterium]
VAATYDITEGVGCEACHGAGSAYKSNKVMKDHAAAVAAGLIEITVDHCLQCHNEKSPIHKEFVYEEALAAIAHPVPE